MNGKLLVAAVLTGGLSSVFLFFFIGAASSVRADAPWSVRETRAAAIFFVQSITAAQIQHTYSASGAATPEKKVRILIVPGHQPDTGGTEFNGVYERDIAVDVADALAALLRQNSHYDVMVARTKTAWNPILQTYFDTHAGEIDAFRKSQALQMASHLADGSFSLETEQVYHNTTPTAAALELYGINKWTSDNGYDITLHLHVNDYAGRRARAPGTYDGFAIYVPEHQYSNAAASRSIAEFIAARLSAYHATSTLPKEDQGVVEDRQLIATGSNNSADDAALLIEYGYIYEPQFQDAALRPLAVADYAYETYLGLQDFVGDPLQSTYGSVSFPYDWSTVTAQDNERGPGTYALQAALRHLGYYPPAYTTFSDCPVSGHVGPCTHAALSAYQSAHSLLPTGELGPQTRDVLNRDLATP